MTDLCKMLVVQNQRLQANDNSIANYHTHSRSFCHHFLCSKTLTKAALLMSGAILCKGGRTVCGFLKVMGLRGEKAFTNYHRVLNRAQWDALKGAKVLLMQIIGSLGITELVVALDDHIERRSGEKISSKGCYRDAVRSSRGFLVRCFGLKWVAMMVVTKLPWSARVFALPFLIVLAPSQKANRAIRLL